MAKKAKKQKTDKMFQLKVNDKKASRDFLKTVKSGKGNLGKSFFKI